MRCSVSTGPRQRDSRRDPSRTTVDKNGSVWASNRAGNSVVHIGLEENGQCEDRNGNGIIDTSRGRKDVKAWTNAGGADTNGGVSTAADECIIHYVRVRSSGTRHVSVDDEQRRLGERHRWPQLRPRRRADRRDQAPEGPRRLRRLRRSDRSQRRDLVDAAPVALGHGAAAQRSERRQLEGLSTRQLRPVHRLRTATSGTPRTAGTSASSRRTARSWARSSTVAPARRAASWTPADTSGWPTRWTATPSATCCPTAPWSAPCASGSGPTGVAVDAQRQDLGDQLLQPHRLAHRSRVRARWVRTASPGSARSTSPPSISAATSTTTAT